MPKRIKLLVLITILWAATAQAQYLTTGKDIFRLQSGENMGKKIVALNAYWASAYEQLELSTGEKYTQAYRTLAITGAYGLTNSIDVLVEATPWQTDEKVDTFGPMGDTRFGVKWGIPQYFGKNIHVGLLGLVVLPTAKAHPIPAEAYSGSGTSFGSKLLYSWDTHLGAPCKLYVNAGYMKWSSNSDDYPLPMESKNQILLGAGIKLSMRKIVLMAEYSRENFIEADSLSGGEQSQRFAIGMRFPIGGGLTLDLGYEADLSKDDPNTAFVADDHDSKIIVSFKKFWFFNKDEKRRQRLMLLERLKSEEAQRLKSLEQDREKVEEEIDALKKLIQEESK